MAEQNLYITIIFGILYTVQMHIAEGMQKHGIGVFKKDGRKGSKKKKGIVWTVGILLMLTVETLLDLMIGIGSHYIMK